MRASFPAIAVLLAVVPSGVGQPATTSPPPAPLLAAASTPTLPTPQLPRVLLIGDSITMEYTPTVRLLLDGRANVERIPENGGATTNGLAHLRGWLGAGQWDVIHFNFGLHDLEVLPSGRRHVSPAAYARNLRRLVGRLEATGATLIWASTTPVPAARLRPMRRRADVVRYNLIARRVMRQAGIGTDDLYAFALPQLKAIQRPSNVHFTVEGATVLGGQVAESIAAALPPA